MQIVLSFACYSINSRRFLERRKELGNWFSATPNGSAGIDIDLIGTESPLSQWLRTG
jgi:hypothetical protein